MIGKVKFGAIIKCIRGKDIKAQSLIVVYTAKMGLKVESLQCDHLFLIVQIKFTIVKTLFAIAKSAFTCVKCILVCKHLFMTVLNQAYNCKTWFTVVKMGFTSVKMSLKYILEWLKL